MGGRLQRRVMKLEELHQEDTEQWKDAVEDFGEGIGDSVKTEI